MQTELYTDNTLSVSSAILFYSRHNIKSMKFKNIIESLNIDMYVVCVDSADVKDRLLNDEKYKIKVIPTVLTIYDSGQFMVYTGNELDNWFTQLIDNINIYREAEKLEIENNNFTDENNYNNNNNYNNSENYTQQSEINTSILGAPGAPPPNLNLSNIPETHKVKEVKKPDINPSELAAEMMKQREQHDENLENNRPFM